MRRRNRSAWAIAAAAAIGVGCAGMKTERRTESAPYVFGWPFVEVPIPPRGGTTRGAEVTLATAPSEAWRRLQEPGLRDRARDRAAILAMAGDYRASFDFLETIVFSPGAAPARPYRSWGTERIYAIEDRSDFISLQHVLVMFVIDESGKKIGPLVQKHWRQDWQYEPRRVLVFAGNERFEMRAVSRAERRGAWSQTVYQVDDSPRYGSVGRWVHGPETSIWEGGEAWRPLPRREHTARSDYQVLAGRNRHTILPTGWVHEQDNLKLALAGETRRLAREVGVDRYDRLRDFDFTGADAYWNATASFWALVRRGWAERAARSPRLRVRTTCGGEDAFVPFFRIADRLESGEAISPEAQHAEIERVLDCVTAD